MTDEPPGGAVVLYELLLALDAAVAGVWDNGSAYHAGIREGLERASLLTRERLARAVEVDRRR